MSDAHRLCRSRLAAKSAELQSTQSTLEAARATKEECERKVAILVDNLRKAEREVSKHMRIFANIRNEILLNELNGCTRDGRS